MLQETNLGSLLTDKSWQEQLKGEFEKEYFKGLSNFVFDEYKEQEVFPCKNNIFRAFNLCSFDKVKVVILGQDPYYKPKQANGLCFSVRECTDSKDYPRSLKNIFKELNSDLGQDKLRSGDLSCWAKQGVLLLNTALTVKKGEPLSHEKEWRQFTDAVLKALSQKKQRIVYLLWGKKAQKKAQKKRIAIDPQKNKILCSYHPSYQNGLCGSKHFSQTNEYLEENGIEPIEW